jgi:aspartate 4-decarboxylase
LKYNAIVVPGEKIAILTPIFSPYLEIPGLRNYNLVQVCVKADEKNNWEIPDSELQKLADPTVKAAFICNPTNPTSLSLSSQTVRSIKNIVRRDNPNIVIIADNVYAPFVDKFNGLFESLPYNTIAVYSFSKYFGVTGWRLGNIIMADSNVIDRRLLKDVDESVHARYSMISLKPEKIPFIDRIMIDSRQVAEAHTAGLSTPQQTIMSLFAMFDLMDTKRVYNTGLKHLLRERMDNVLDPIHYTIQESDLNANYYVVIDLIKAVNGLVGGSDFGNYLQKHRDPLEFLMKLAKDYATVLLPAVGFAGPFWGVRISLANLPTDDYIEIGENLRSLIDQYYTDFQRWKERERRKAAAEAKKKAKK